MAQEQQSLSGADKAFIQKLGRFRTTLSADEQQKLDALVLAAHGVEQGGAVSGYQGGAGQVGPPWFYGNDPDNPQWYGYGGGTSGGAGTVIPGTPAPAWTAGYRPY